MSGLRHGRRWYNSHRHDPYVKRARVEGRPSRASYKLAEIDERTRLLRPGLSVVDLGAAPGGWTTEAWRRIAPAGCLIAVDQVSFPAPPGVTVLVHDVTDVDGLVSALRTRVPNEGIDLILSDLAPKLTGIRERDEAAMMRLGEAAIALARALLRPSGALLTKTFHGLGGQELRGLLAETFVDVKSLKPAASRAESAEYYLLARRLRVV